MYCLCFLAVSWTFIQCKFDVSRHSCRLNFETIRSRVNWGTRYSTFILHWTDYAKWCATKGVFMVLTFTRWYDWLELISYWIKYEFLVSWVYSIIVCQYLLMKLINIVYHENGNFTLFMYVYDTLSWKV